MSRNRQARPPGQLRRSQVVTTFGPGSLMDLPNHSVIVGGLDHWVGVGDEVHEPRLAEKLKRLLGLPTLKLFSPPPDPDDETAPQTGIRGWQFPEWFVTQDVADFDGRGTRSRRLVHRKGLTKGKYYGDDRKSHPVVPIRFVRACRRGHIGDIDWSGFVHQKNPTCRRPLWMVERGTSGDISEIMIVCDCGESRPLVNATLPGALGHCDGGRPWLGPFTKEACTELNRLLVRTASNAYFAHIMSVISLPDKNEALGQAVSQAWSFLEAVESADEVKYERKKPAVKAALDGLTDEEVWQEVQARNGQGDGRPVRSVKAAEFEILSTTQEKAGEDSLDSNFFARALPAEAWTGPLTANIERVVLVHRLREVVAQVGFTRFEANTPDVEGELQMGVEAAPLAREPTWLPAIENRGEGVFIQFRQAAINEWLARPAVQDRGRRLLAGFEGWRAEHPKSHREFPGLPYYLLHSLSHLLLTAVSLECGYPASSIRERVYASTGGSGILLYTGTPDAEGTLGGLVEAGKQISRHLRAALELGRLCSNDPVCAQHDPANQHESRYLHGASCHGCLLVAETSCEQHNDFLDRALLVPTVEDGGAEFFRTGGA